jgi:non-specific serine/threonine protein kinase
MLLVLTPQGHLRLTAAAEAPALADDLAQRLDASFARGGGHGLLQLGAAEADTPLPAAFAYWRELQFG